MNGFGGWGSGEIFILGERADTECQVAWERFAQADDTQGQEYR